jgi:phosphoglycolate phosphatase
MGPVETDPSTHRLAPTAVVFDKDGTLVDLHARWVPWIRSLVAAVADACGDAAAVGALEATLGVAGDRLIADSPAAVANGEGIRTAAIDVMVRRGHGAASAAASVSAAYRAASAGPLLPLGDVAGTFRELAARGYALAVATNDDRANTIAELRELEVLQLMGGIRCGDDPGPNKPDPEVLLGLAADLRISAAEMIFVGDSISDLATSRDAAVPFVAVVAGSSAGGDLRDGAAATISDVGELLGLLR